MGNPDGMEARIVPASGYEVAWVRFTALRGKGLLRKLLLPFNLLRALPRLAQIRRVRPDVVLGMGGYVTFPGGMMAVLLGAAPGGRARAEPSPASPTGCWPASPTRSSPASPTPAKGEWLGNPVRADITAVAPPAVSPAVRGPLRVLVVGGSLGAAAA